LAPGLGIGRLPRFLAKAQVRPGQLARVLPDWALPDVPVHAVADLAIANFPSI
jgi:DNA-binding transcriptional LysR family regulator